MVRLVAWSAMLLAMPAAAQPIDRQALVQRHDVVLTEIDPHAPVMLGNGELGFTADITGLQTFPERYSELVPLLTMAQWGWHSFPEGAAEEAAGLVQVPVPGRGEQPYAWMRSWADAESNPALNWLRANPHRIALGRIAMMVDGAAPDFAQVSGTRQQLDLWTGTLTSRFAYAGQPVTVVTRVLPGRDAIAVEVTSPLVEAGRLALSVRYPGVDPQINPDPARWDGGGTTELVSVNPQRVHLRRDLDATRYWSAVESDGTLAMDGDAGVLVTGTGTVLRLQVAFDQTAEAAPLPPFADSAAAVASHWRSFWTEGGAVDFTGSTDPRAAELERRVVLSQYLSAINGAGTLPPQEEGLFSNSWFGKFHLEMHPWHAAWQAMWGHADMLERSLPWYVAHLPHAREEAARHGVEGAWWPKMVGPEGRNSPSLVSPFLMWQQPHPILMAELVRRAKPDDAATLRDYGEVVEASADLLASWPLEKDGRRDLGPPLIPAQENYDPLTTVNPTFELAYFRWALNVAQQWRERQGLAPKPAWTEALRRLAPLPMKDGLYLPAESEPDFWQIAASAACSGAADAAQCKNRDHPSFMMAYGFIPGEQVDTQAMGRTLSAISAHWDLRQTWGWDFPMLAMASARLGRPEEAVDWLFAERKNNQWGVTGMTPRVHLDAHAEDLVPVSGGAGGVAMATNPDGAGFRRAAETYFPSNGALLWAVGLMAAGWDGAEGHAPGFPAEGWTVRAEGIAPAP
jgi:hypothetical protein